MKFKTFTQAYLLIKNNSKYTYSLGERAKAVVFNGSIFTLGLYGFWTPRIKANDQIWYRINQSSTILNIITNIQSLSFLFNPNSMLHIDWACIRTPFLFYSTFGILVELLASRFLTLLCSESRIFLKAVKEQKCVQKYL